MSRLTLDPSTLRVESFEGVVPIIIGAGGETYPDCPTATGCTCVDACISIVRPPCQETVAVATA
ncbi:MAG TPA: hypothetical protein VF092_04400 [Longimicrobium sp.]